MRLSGPVLLIFLLFTAFVSAGSSGIYIEPPIEFDNVPLKTVLTSLFMNKDNISYSLDSDSIETAGSLSLRIRQKIALEDILELVLAPRGLRAERDKAGIFHITKKIVSLKIVGSSKKDSEYYIVPPLDFSEISLKTALDMVFMSQPESSYIFDTNEADLSGNVNIKIQRKISIDEFFSIVLKSKPVTFYRDSREIYHIIRRSDYDNSGNVKVSTYMGKRTVQDLIREAAERSSTEGKKEEVELLVAEEAIKCEAPLEFKDAKLSEFIGKVLPDAFVVELSDLDGFGPVNLKISSPMPLSMLLEMVFSGKGLKAEPDSHGIFHIKQGKTVLKAEKRPLTEKENIFLDPPIDFQDAPLKMALESVLQKTKISYCFAVENGGNELLNVSFRLKTDLVNFLKIILEPNGYMFFLDANSVLQIRNADGSWVHPAVLPLPGEKKEFHIQNIYYDPPFEFREASLKKVLREVFVKSALSYSVEVKNIEEQGTVTILVQERMQLENILVLLLDHRGLAFEVDDRGMFHIKQALVTNVTSTSSFEVGEFGKKSEMSERAEKYMEKTLGELGFSGVKGLSYKEALAKIFTSVGRLYTDMAVGDLGVYGKVAIEISGGKTLGEILREILQPKGLSYFVNANGVYNIVKAESREKYSANRIYNYSTSGKRIADLKAELANKMSSEGELKSEEASTTLTITDTPENIDAIDNFLFYGM